MGGTKSDKAGAAQRVSARSTGAPNDSHTRRTGRYPDYSYGAKNVEAIRTILGVPMLKGEDLLGVIMIYRLRGSSVHGKASRTCGDICQPSGNRRSKM